MRRHFVNPAVILALISDLYSQVTALAQERDRLAAELAEAKQHECAQPRAES
jgi:hypothetical protein